MTDFVERNSTHLGADRIFTSPTAWALYENLLAVAEGSTGAPQVKGASLVLLQSLTASGSTGLSFDNAFSTAYDVYAFDLINILSANDAVTLYGRVGSSGVYDSSGNDYTTLQQNSDGAQNQFVLTNATNGVENATTTGGINGRIWVYGPLSSSHHKRILAHLFYFDTSGVERAYPFCGTYAQAGSITDMQFLFSSGNILSGTIRLYGVRNTHDYTP